MAAGQRSTMASSTNAVPGSSRMGFASSSNNNQQAQLANAYQQLGKELGTNQCKVVGGYTIGRIIGEGTYGSVYLATHRLTGTRCAIKRIPKSVTPSLARELHQHRRLHHPNIVHLHEIIATETHVWLVTELCAGGELYDYLVEKGRILEAEARRLFGELVVAVGHLHRQGIVHRDLKLENILLDEDLRIKVGDLGFAREWRRGQLLETFCGTTGYASPEMLQGRKYLGAETDIWSLGVILYTLLCGGLPFDDDDEGVMRSMIAKGEYEEPEWLSKDAASLIRGMLKLEPSERLSIEAILAHPWFTSSNSHPHRQPVTPSPKFTPKDVVTPQMPLHAILSPLAEVQQTPSEASSQDLSDIGKTESESTAPTTAEDIGDEPDHHSLTDQTETDTSKLDLKHPNNSQVTIKRDPSQDTLANKKPKVAQQPNLEGHAEEDENEELPSSEHLVPADHPLFQTTSHSRTPSRTKRRSVSSNLSLERKHSHHSSMGDATPKVDYLAALNRPALPLFSGSTEKSLLASLDRLGFDVGQLIHSVKSDACDASAGMWWILLSKQRRDDPELLKTAEPERIESRRTEPPKAVKQGTDITKRPKKTSPTEEASRTESRRPAASRFIESQWDESNKKQLLPGPTTPPSERDNALESASSSTAGAESFREDVSPTRPKLRSPSMSMLQRATSAFTGANRKKEDVPDEEKPTTVHSEGKASPTKLVKPQPRAKPADDVRATPTEPQTPGGGESSKSQTPLARGSVSPINGVKTPKRDSLWTTFRQLFNEDKRRKKAAAHPVGTPDHHIGGHTVTLSRGPAARHHTHIHRTPQNPNRHTSMDGGRPAMHSRRSSSVNSRRSSITSAHVPHDHHDALLALSRRISHQSQGSQTPTSEKEFDFPPRPGSGHSNRYHRQSVNSLRSPSLNSNSSSRFDSHHPSSPLHNYHRGPSAGSSSARVRHIKVITSKASSTKSTASSRASSISLAGDDSDMVRMGKKRNVFPDKDDEWEDEDEQTPTFAGGLGQGASSSSHWHATPSHASHHPKMITPASRKRRPRSRKGSTNADEVTEALNRLSSYSRRTALPSGTSRQPLVIVNEDEEEESVDE